MASKNKPKGNKAEKGDIDELDFSEFENEDFSGDLDFDEVDSSRSPSKLGVAKELAESAVRDGTSTFISRTAKKALPPEYEDHYYEAMDYADFGRTIFTENKQKLDRSMYKLGREVKKVLPFKIGMLDKYLENAESEHETQRQETEEAQRDASIQSSLTSIFDKQIEVQKAIEAKREASDDVDKKEDMVKTKLNLDILKSIDSNTGNSSSFTLQITKEYYRKSLELQYKMYFVQADTLKTIKDYYKGFSVQFESIVKNTGLPDYVKLTSSEVLKEELKRQAAKKIYEKTFSNNEYVQGVKKRISGAISNKVSSVTDAIGGATDALEQINSTSGDMGGSALGMLGNIASGMLGSSVAEKISDKFSPKIKDKIKDNKIINTGANHLANLANSPSSYFAGLRDTVAELKDKYSAESTPLEQLMSKMLGVASAGLDLTKVDAVDTKVADVNLSSMTSPAVFDNKVHKSITEVIPAYLAKILVQNTSLTSMFRRANREAIGDEGEANELVYNFESRGLSTMADIKAAGDKYISAAAGRSNNKAATIRNSLVSGLERQVGTAKAGESEERTKARKERLASIRKVTQNKDSNKKLEQFITELSKEEGVNLNYETLVTKGIAIAGNSSNAKLRALSEDSAVAEYIDVISKNSSKESTKNADKTIVDTTRDYPINAILALFKASSTLAGEKAGFNIKPEIATLIAKAFSRYLGDRNLSGGQDVTVDAIIKRGAPARGLPAIKEGSDLTAADKLLNKQIKEALECLSIFAHYVSKIKAIGEPKLSELQRLLGAVNLEIRNRTNTSIESVRQLDAVYHQLGLSGKEMSYRTMAEGRLITKNEDEASFKEISKEDTVKYLKLPKEELQKLKDSRLRSGVNDSIESIASSGKNIGSTASKVFKDIKSQNSIFDMVKAGISGVGEISKSAKDEAVKNFDKAKSNLEGPISRLGNSINATTAKAALASINTYVKAMEKGIKEIDALKASLIKSRDDNVRGLEELKKIIVDNNLARDSGQESARIDKQIESIGKSTDASIKKLETTRTALTKHITSMNDIKNNSNGLGVAAIINKMSEITKQAINTMEGIAQERRAERSGMPSPSDAAAFVGPMREITGPMPNLQFPPPV